MISKQRKALDPDYSAICPDHIIEQAAAFTAPRGRLEMGGVLVGHVDENGANVTVTGFFPEQIEETSGYCMFDGKWMAIAAAACDYANSTVESEGPQIRVIGWIHTHPDIGIFLSGIDVKTFQQLRNQCPERRFVAVVVDPLRNEHGVFNTEKQPNRPGQSVASIEISDDLAQRYDIFLDRMRTIQTMHGTNALPCILPGSFRYKRLIAGDRDDVGIAEKQGFFSIKKAQIALAEKIQKTEDRIVKVSRDKQALSNSQQVLENSLKQTKTEVRNDAIARKNLEDLIQAQAKRIQHLEELMTRVNGENENLVSMLGNLNGTITQMHRQLQEYESRNTRTLDTLVEANSRILQRLDNHELSVRKRFAKMDETNEGIIIRRQIYRSRHGKRMRYRRGQ